LLDADTEGKNPDYVARGLKAALHNDRVSDEAKESVAERLQEMGVDVPEYETSSGDIVAEEEYVAEEESVSNDTVTAKGATLNPNQERGMCLHTSCSTGMNSRSQCLR
jgi:hypothetical protein